jgi:hypothetical protein
MSSLMTTGLATCGAALLGAYGKFADQLFVQRSLHGLQPPFWRVNQPMTALAFRDRKRYVVGRGLPLAVHTVVAELLDGYTQRAGQFLFVFPKGQTIAPELFGVCREVPNVPVSRP